MSGCMTFHQVNSLINCMSIVCIHCMSYLYCFYYYFYFISFVYFSVHCTLCIFVFYNHCCLVRINKWNGMKNMLFGLLWIVYRITTIANVYILAVISINWQLLSSIVSILIAIAGLPVTKQYYLVSAKGR